MFVGLAAVSRLSLEDTGGPACGLEECSPVRRGLGHMCRACEGGPHTPGLIPSPAASLAWTPVPLPNRGSFCIFTVDVGPRALEAEEEPAA